MEAASSQLTRTAFVSRQGIKVLAVVLVTLMVGRVFWGSVRGFIAMLNPPKPPPPTVGFGVLPAPVFPAQSASDRPSAYQLEIVQSRFPVFPDRAKVFLMPKNKLSLFADQRIREIASQLGFPFEPAKLTDRQYQWTKSSPLNATLEMEIVDNVFALSTDYLSRPELLSKRNVLPDQQAISLVKSLVANAQPLPDIATASAKVTYLKSVGTQLEPAASFSDADFSQIDIQRYPVDGIYQAYTPKGKEGIVHAIVTGSFSGRDAVVEMAANARPVDYTQVHTYPLRPLTEAWQVFQAGQGYVAQKGQFETAVIRDIYLGYYDSFDSQEYYQPIYVFEGDGGFVGFVPAIASQYLTTSPAQ